VIKAVRIHNVETAELNEWTDFTPSHLCMAGLIECENSPDLEADLDTFDNAILDDSAFCIFDGIRSVKTQ
jgi:hypothetical protein